MDFEQEISSALIKLAASVQVTGPICTASHRSYIVTGLADTDEQMTNLCLCLLGFIGGIFEVDLSIDSAIGTGAQASDNLIKILKKRLSIDQTLTARQKERNRDPLVQELISHTLVLIHQRKPLFPEWLADIQSCRPPHLSANDPGLDLIAVANEDGNPFPVIGEVKAYEKNPLGGFGTACVKFTQVRQGEYNDEIREAIKKSLDINSQFTKQQLADNVWITIGRFGALVGYDSNYRFDENKPSTQSEVIAQDTKRLFFISSPYNSMRVLFDTLVDYLVELANNLGQ
ncbi:MAG: hypothetical protein DRP09_16505 [Candidatus Thorarchaeota archaeon]|nr:MAG: hypothetical protein DRP09_16505 [Candidatus Thorarchaeota archaeon]